VGPTTKRIVISLGVGFLVTALLLNVSINISNPYHAVTLANVALWPVLVCGELSVYHGLPPNLGTLEKPLYDARRQISRFDGDGGGWVRRKRG
jgi:hypothetical protein